MAMLKLGGVFKSKVTYLVIFFAFLWGDVHARSRRQVLDRSMYLADKLTIITTTSPIASNPSTEIIEQSIKSLSKVEALIPCKKIIVFDGIRDQDEHGYCRKNIEQIRKDYDQFKKNMTALTEDTSNPHFQNTRLLFLPEFKHQAWALQEAMKHVDTPYVYLHQHDIIIIREFDAAGIVYSMECNPQIKLVRACNGENEPNDYDGPVDECVEGGSFVPLVRSFRFADAEQFTTVKYYEDMVFPRVKGHGFSEYWVMEPNFKQMQQEIIKNHSLWGTYIYGRLKEPTCLKHLDGRERR